MTSKGQHFMISFAGAVMAAWAGVPGVYQALVIMTFLDMFTGIIKASVLENLSSKQSYKGALRKSLSFALVGMGLVAEHKLGLGMNLGTMIATFFCISDAISIIENCHQAGVTLPEGLTKVFKIYGEKNGVTNTTGR